MKSPSRPINLHHLTIALLILFGLPDRNQCAPVEEEDVEGGCYYMFNHYGEGDRILTNEPCLNCTCHNSMLMCYLRVCPFTKPIGQDCTIEKKPDQCCPVITCPQVPVSLVTPSALVTTTSTTTVATVSSSEVALLDRGCEMDGKYYPDGAQVASDVSKPCELCYCIRNRTACVMQECILHVEGCKPIFQSGVCCPVRYQCDGPMEIETTTQGFGNMISTTISNMFGVISSTPQPGGCLRDGQYYADGSQIPNPEEDACNHCYCMRGDIVCAVQECGSPLENEGGNCTAIPPRAGLCCPEKYACQDSYVGPRQGKLFNLTYMHTKNNETTESPILDDESSGQTTLQPVIAPRPTEIGITAQHDDESELTTVPSSSSSLGSHKPSVSELPVGSTETPTENEVSSTTAPKISNLNNVVSSTTEPRDTTGKENVSDDHAATTLLPILASDKPEKEESTTLTKGIESEEDHEHEASTLSSASISSSSSTSSSSGSEPEALNTHSVSSTTEAGATLVTEATTIPQSAHQSASENENVDVGGASTVIPTGQQDNEAVTTKPESSSAGSSSSVEPQTTSPSVSQQDIILPQDSITGLPPSENLVSSTSAASASASEKDKETETTLSPESAHYDPAVDKIDTDVDSVPATTVASHESHATQSDESKINENNVSSSTHGTSAEMVLTTTPETPVTIHEGIYNNDKEFTTISSIESASSSSTASSSSDSSASHETVHDIAASTLPAEMEDEVPATTISSRIQEKPSSSSSSPSEISEPETTIASAGASSEQHDAQGEHSTEPSAAAKETNKVSNTEEAVFVMTTQKMEPSEVETEGGQTTTQPKQVAPLGASTEIPSSQNAEETATKKVEESESGSTDGPTTTLPEHLGDSTTEKLVMSSSSSSIPTSNLATSEAPVTEHEEQNAHDDIGATTASAVHEGESTHVPAKESPVTVQSSSEKEPEVTTISAAGSGQSEEGVATTQEPRLSSSSTTEAAPHTTHSSQELSDDTDEHTTSSHAAHEVEASTTHSADKPVEGQTVKVEATTVQSPSVGSTETETKVPAPEDDVPATTVLPALESSSSRPVSTPSEPQDHSSIPAHEEAQTHPDTTVAPESHGATVVPPFAPTVVPDETEYTTFASISSEPAASSVATERIIPTTISPVSEDIVTVHEMITLSPNEQHPASDSSASTSSQPPHQAGSGSTESSEPAQTSHNILVEASTELPSNEQNIPTTIASPSQEEIESKIQSHPDSANQIRPTFNVSSTEGHTVIIPDQQDNKEPIPVMPLQRENVTNVDSSSSSTTAVPSQGENVTPNADSSSSSSTSTSTAAPAITAQDKIDASSTSRPTETESSSHSSADAGDQHDESENAIEDHSRETTSHEKAPPATTPKEEPQPQPTVQPGVSEGATQQSAEASKPTERLPVESSDSADDASVGTTVVPTAELEDHTIHTPSEHSSSSSSPVETTKEAEAGVTQQPIEHSSSSSGTESTKEEEAGAGVTQQPLEPSSSSSSPVETTKESEAGATQQPIDHSSSSSGTEPTKESEAGVTEPTKEAEAGVTGPAKEAEAGVTQQPIDHSSSSSGTEPTKEAEAGVTGPAKEVAAEAGVTQQPLDQSSSSVSPAVTTQEIEGEATQQPSGTEATKESDSGVTEQSLEHSSSSSSPAVTTQEAEAGVTHQPIEHSSSSSGTEPTKEAEAGVTGPAKEAEAGVTQQPIEHSSSSSGTEPTKESEAGVTEPTKESEAGVTHQPLDDEATTVHPHPASVPSVSIVETATTSPAEELPGTTFSSVSSEPKKPETASEKIDTATTVEKVEVTTVLPERDAEDSTSSSAQDVSSSAQSTSSSAPNISSSTDSSSPSSSSSASSSDGSEISESVTTEINISNGSSEGTTSKSVESASSSSSESSSQSSTENSLEGSTTSSASDYDDAISREPEELPSTTMRHSPDASVGAGSSSSSEDKELSSTAASTESEESPIPDAPARIPGEGSCFVEGITYRNGSRIPPSTSCQLACACQNSIVHCLLVHCPPPPSDTGDCKPVYKAGICCPKYECDATSSAPSVTVTPEPDQKGVTPIGGLVTVTGRPVSSTEGITAENKLDDDNATIRPEGVATTVSSEGSQASQNSEAAEAKPTTPAATVGETSSHPSTPHSQDVSHDSEHDINDAIDEPEATYMPEFITVQPGSSVAPEISNLENKQTTGAGILKPESTSEAGTTTTEAVPLTSTSVESHTEISSVSSSSSSSVASISSMTSSSGPGKANVTVSNEGAMNATSNQTAPTVDEKFGQSQSHGQSVPTATTPEADAPSSSSSSAADNINESTPLSSSSTTTISPSPLPLNETELDAGSPLENSSSTAGSKYPVTTTTSVTPSPAPWPYPSSSTASPSASMSSGACLFDGRVYMSAQQIPRDDPCDFCFCFRGDIICLQQSCPPPIPGCYEEPIPGFCCPRYECPVGSGNSTTAPPLFPPSYYHSQLLNNAAQPNPDKGISSNMATGPGCEIQGEYYETGQVIVSTSGPCLECRCGSTGMMECDPRECQPEPMLRKMIAAITSR